MNDACVYVYRKTLLQYDLVNITLYIYIIIALLSENVLMKTYNINENLMKIYKKYIFCFLKYFHCIMINICLCSYSILEAYTSN